jgi:glyceraldehyde-3-phosphate dehydrogenase (NADP+)
MDLKERIESIFPDEQNLPAALTAGFPIEQKEYLVGGELLRWNGPVQDVLSCVCVNTPQGVRQKRLGSYPLLTKTEACQALDAAVNAYGGGRGPWATMSVAARIACVEDFTRKMQAGKSAVVNCLMWEIGKSAKDAEKEFDRTVEYILATIAALKELDRASSRLVIEDGIVGQIRRSPLGVALCMGPFNYPLNETFTTFIPALLMGNTVVFKPAKLGVLLHRPLLDAYASSFPPGVVNIVYGDGPSVIGPIMETGKVDILAFIGSSQVADALKRQHPAPHRLRCALGLGAKNPAIVLADADLDLAIQESRLGALSFNGQRCTALKIFFVHRSIADTFVARLSQAVEQLVPGLPWDKGVDITPLPESEKPGYFSALVADAVANGANVVNPHGGLTNGTFFFPAILYPVNDRMRLYREEQFGPVIPILPFDDIEEPIRYITQSPFGQQAALFGRDPDVIADLIDPLVNQVSRLNINSQCQRGPDTFPFTGRKDSAEGTLSVSDALRVFSIRSLVAAKQNDPNKNIITTILRERMSNFLSTDFIL